MQLNQIHPSPLLACGEGVGGGVLVSHSTENRYIVLSRLVLKIVVMARGKSEEARGKSEEGLGDFTFLYTVWFYCVHLLISQLFKRFIFNKIS